MQTHFMKTSWLFPLIILIALLWGSGASVPTGLTPIKAAEEKSAPMQAAQRVTPDFRKFARQWVAHGAALNFLEDGRAFFVQRVYRWCGRGVARPCDTIGRDGRITSGYREHIQFTRVSGSVAYGTIIASNLHPKGLPVAAILKPDDTLLYAGKAEIALLCGPRAPVGACGA